VRKKSSANSACWRIGVLAALVAGGLQAAPAVGAPEIAAPAAAEAGPAGMDALIGGSAPSNAPIRVPSATNVVVSQAQAGVAESAPAVPVSEAVPESPDAVVPEAAAPEMVEVPGSAAPVEAEERITIALDDVPLQDVVRMFTRISGANIIASATNLGGKVTVNLQEVEWKPALSSILDIYNMQISEKIPGSGIYSVMPKAPGSEDPLVSATIFLGNASVATIATLVTPLLMKGGTVSPFPNCNALVVRSTALNVNEIRKVITEIDLPRKQVYIEAKFLELNDEAIKDLGINWQVLEGYGVGVGSMQWSVEETRSKLKSRSDTLTRQDSRTRTDALTQSLDANGNPVNQDTVTETLNPITGIPISTTVTEPSRSVNDSINQSVTAQRDVKDTFEKTVSDVRTAVLSADDFKVILSALKQMNGVSVVSNPKIIVANEQTATIHIGENEPNIKGTVTPGQQGQANSTTYELDPAKPYFEFGIKLDVTPTINNVSNITVAINPTLSRFVRNKVTPDNNSFPVESTKTIKTTFALESGRTAAIGGLTETEDRKVEKKIPLLGDIPLIGKYLFTHTHDSRVQQETIIFVTVGIAEPGRINRDDGLPEDADLVHRHISKKSQASKEAITNALPEALTNGLPPATTARVARSAR
jgi:type II secretory pathway component GspD/PulD (secretin)